MITDWKGEYFANISLQSPAEVVRNDRVIDFSLPRGAAPATNMPSKNWSARWTRTWRFDEGNYRFHLVVDDGARLWVGGRFLIDAWADGGAREYVADLYLRGDTPIQLDYYNHLGDARIRLNWELVTQFAGWKGSYYASAASVSGMPVFQRDDPNIDFDWGTGSPRPDLPADDFSVSWSRRLKFAQAGLYRFQATSDDGVRMWVDGKPVIDAWHDGQGTYEGQAQLTAGDHDLRVDYYEHTGQAFVELNWSPVPGATTTPTQTRTPTGTPKPTESPVATPTSTPTVTEVPPTQTPITPAATATAVPPTETPIPSTSTVVAPTETPIPPTATVIQPTETPIPPTETLSPPTATSALDKPVIALDPTTGPIGQPFAVVGQGWPAGLAIDLFLTQPSVASREHVPVTQVVSDGTGRFSAQVVVPAGVGWEGQESAGVTAVSSSTRDTAAAVYKLLPELRKVAFTPLPAIKGRGVLAGPTYLVLGSAAEWAAQFGPEPPPGQPPVDWQREIVIGAFVGSNPARPLNMTKIVQRDTTVSIWLSIPVGTGGVIVQPGQGGVETAWSLVRVAREALRPAPGQTPPTGLTFAFLDAIGRLLAQGPAGVVPPTGPAAKAVAPEQLLVAPGPTQEAAAMVQVTQEVAQATAAIPATAAPTPIKAAPSARNVVVWGLLLVGIVILAGLGLTLARRHRK